MTYARASQGIRSGLFVSSMGKETESPANLTAPSSSTLSTNVLYIMRFILPTATVIRRYYWANGATASTNTVQVGVYNDDLSTFKLGTATTASGASALQFDNITDTPIGAGRYWMAVVVNGTTTTLMRISTGSARGTGLYTQANAGLPATLNPVQSANILPLFGFTSVA